MANTYTWSVMSMSSYPTYESQTNVVFEVFCSVSGSNGTQSTAIPVTQSVTYTAGSAFTPYAQLTQEQVIGWVQNAMGASAVSALEAQLDAALAALPSNQVLPLPWQPA